MAMNKHINHFITSLIDWLFRVKTVPAILLKAGLLCLSFSLIGGWALKVKVPLEDGDFIFDYDSSGFTPALITYITFVVAIGLILTSALIYINVYFRENRLADKKKIISIESRGLRDGAGEPLSKYIPQKNKVRPIEIILDLRQKVEDGFIVKPDVAIRKILTLQEQLESHTSQYSREYIEVYFGGLTPVPLNVLNGIIFDDECKITIMDWDRHSSEWKTLDKEDDEERYTIQGVKDVQATDNEVLLVISSSYLINSSLIQKQFPSMKLVTMFLPAINTDNLWSEIKQVELGKQFLHAVADLSGLGVKRIHLFLAAPNSLCFRFGRLYDKRNLPELVVYQYERNSDVTYPWGILMPVAGIQVPEVIHCKRDI